MNQDPYKYKYKLVNDPEPEVNKTIYSVKTLSDDGLYHPEQVPAYSDLFQGNSDVVIEVDFDSDGHNAQSASFDKPERTVVRPKDALVEANHG